MPVAEIDMLPSSGLHPEWIARNGSIVSGPALTALARYENLIASRRLRVHFKHLIQPSDTTNYVADTTTWRTYFRTSPNVSQVWVRMTFAPPEVHATTLSRGYWVVTPSGGAAVTQDTLYDQRYVTGGSSVFQNRYTYVDQRLVSNASTDADLVGDTVYSAVWHCIDHIRPIGAVIYEVPSLTLDPSVAGKVGIDPSVFRANAHILDRDVEDLWGSAQTVWKRQGASIFSWTVDNTTAKTVTGTTYRNILDGGTGGWSASAPGWYHWPYRCGSFDSSNVPVLFWVYANSNAGTDGNARLVGQGGTYVTIANINTTAAFYTGTGNLKADYTSENLIVEANQGSGNTISVYAAGAYHYSA